MISAIKIDNSDDGTPTLPARFYHDPASYEAERRTVFFDQWLLYGHEDLVRAPGQHLTRNIAGWPVFVIRDKNGDLRAHHNVCRPPRVTVASGGSRDCFGLALHVSWMGL
ncbi:MAG: hypothetical protein JWO78_661 [Micavibrio sp.]|nr:hypothetical protein [Micavibrio sp.]